MTPANRRLTLVVPVLWISGPRLWEPEPEGGF